jgi:hypothetical protein
VISFLFVKGISLIRKGLTSFAMRDGRAAFRI